MEKINQFVGERIRSLRKSKGLTQAQLGEKVDLPQPYVGGIERGERNISLDTLQKIMSALRVTPEELFRQYQSADSSLKEYLEIMDRIHDELSKRNVQEVKIIEKLISEVLATFDSLKNCN